jgi:hypothetical protein
LVCGKLERIPGYLKGIKWEGHPKDTNDIPKDQSVVEMTVWSPWLWLLVLLFNLGQQCPFQKGEVSRLNVRLEEMVMGVNGHNGQGRPSWLSKNYITIAHYSALKRKERDTWVSLKDIIFTLDGKGNPTLEDGGPLDFLPLSLCTLFLLGRKSFPGLGAEPRWQKAAD